MVASLGAQSSSKAPSDKADKSNTRIITRKRAILGRGQPGSASVKPLGVLFVATKAPFMSVVKRAIKMLEKGPGGPRWSSTKVKSLSLPERIAQAQEAPVHAGTTTAATGAGSGVSYKSARQREVVMLGTSHAIQKLVLVAAWFQRQQGYVVTTRTRSAVSVDDVYTFVGGEGDEDEEKEGEEGDTDAMDVDTARKTTKGTATAPTKSARLRNLSCLEVAVRLI